MIKLEKYFFDKVLVYHYNAPLFFYKCYNIVTERARKTKQAKRTKTKE